MKQPRWSHEVRLEILEAAQWYFEKGVGDRFETALQDAVAMVLEAPTRWPVCRDRRLRRILVASFPYWLIYQLVGNEDVVFAALRHHRRRPNPRFLP